MADDSDTPGKRRLPRWVRVVLCIAQVPVLIVGLFVGIGFWPRLNFEVELVKGRDSRLPAGIIRKSLTGTRKLELLHVSCIMVAVGWRREAVPEGLKRGWGTASGGLKVLSWRSDHHVVYFWWPAP